MRLYSRKELVLQKWLYRDPVDLDLLNLRYNLTVMRLS